MSLEGGCYCKAVRYVAEGEPQARVQCHCRECQYITGGGPNMFIVMPEVGFRYQQGQAKAFQRSDLERPVTREFCPDCGTHLLTRSPARPGAVILKVGTLDDTGVYGMPEAAIFMIDRPEYHPLPEGIKTFDRRPG